MKATRVFLGSVTALLFLAGVSPAAFFQKAVASPVGSGLQERSKLTQVNSQGSEGAVRLSQGGGGQGGGGQGGQGGGKQKPKPSPSK